MACSLARLLRDYLTEWLIHQNRLVTKEGHCNIEYANVRYKNWFNYMLDIWTTLVEIHWTFLIFFFVASFILTWFGFALLWYWVGGTNGDLWWQNPSANHSACVINVYDLTTAFLYSLETQTFIAYGLRAITTLCPGAVAVYVFQVILGTIIPCFWGGVVMAKLSLPKRRAKAIMFSKMAVICSRQDTLCLKIRVANLRKSLMIGTKIYGKLIKTTTTPEGETIIMDQVNIDFSVETGKDNLFFISPLTLYHVIDQTSPFFEMAVDTLQNQDFELVVFMDSVAESTSFSCQVRTSYIPKEIMWGYQFLPIIFRNSDGKYCVDFSNFAKVMRMETPHCSHCFHNEKAHQRSGDGTDNEGFGCDL
ncbi:ATP-sensitive inward rectifier potassium channel 1-like [Pangasianodon hypophthalmus]|uniref:ATP-sensitive inward rectifier potassium channel 1-like n=1 Tax=Pangasianodon hypophthalmus TaxID=310915 RepID=UPI000F00337F|nr:ATP-sensitive inward rectifier potassium channel 1-like [Pangasianodon hypophthalmus]